MLTLFLFIPTVGTGPLYVTISQSFLIVNRSILARWSPDWASECWPAFPSVLFSLAWYWYSYSFTYLLWKRLLIAYLGHLNCCLRADNSLFTNEIQLENQFFKMTFWIISGTLTSQPDNCKFQHRLIELAGFGSRKRSCKVQDLLELGVQSSDHHLCKSW